tara:strand:- start:874 stop:1566 length:693 start_codon:yes stop_codon:yes gene_type:complete
MNKLLIIIPTYNEKKNINFIYKKIKRNVKKFDLLFIDDNSPDNTKDLIFKLKKKNNNIKLFIRKKKKGIGSAHKFGLSWAYKKKYFKVFTMDADGTHDPKYVNSMLKLSNEADIVLTNRFLKKKSLVDWPLHRKFLTYLRFFVINFLFNNSHDSSGAFRCYNIKNIKLSDILRATNNSYSFFWESILILKKKYIIKEIPIKLQARYLGESKMRLKDIIEAIKYILKIYLK